MQLMRISWYASLKICIFFPEVIAEIEQNIIQFFTRQEQLTVIQCKELLQISRKYAIELLEYFDASNNSLAEMKTLALWYDDGKL